MSERPENSQDGTPARPAADGGAGIPREDELVVAGENTVDEPRREASARFVVERNPSSAADLRDAMDPANQSLADALRLSYRVLQLGILALIVTFLFSGFQSVRDGATGVKTIFGKIVGSDSGISESLSPGLHPFWPYPIGELVVFDQKRTIRLDKEFQPATRDNLKTREDQLNAADTATTLTAGRDGFILTADGDIAHLSISATYAVQDAVEFLEATTPEQAEQIVKMALMRASVLVGGQFSLRELMDQRDAPAVAMREAAQAALESLQTGIDITEVTIVDRAPPRFVEARFTEVQQKRDLAQAVVEVAKQEVASILNGIAEETARRELNNLIRSYDAALTAGQSEEADTLLAAIGARIDEENVGGEVSRIVERARASASTNEALLNRELSRITGFAAAYDANPRQLTRQLWLESLAQVLRGPEMEIVSVPPNFGMVDLVVKSSQQIMQARRAASLERAKQAADALEMNMGMHLFRGSQIKPGGDMKRLERDATKGTGRDDIKVNTSSSSSSR
jgi:regulator of protease activity HflC (stomatin/prohibitin superfamily)